MRKTHNIKSHIVLVFICIVSCISSTSGQNIAKGKKYIFSEIPNYSLTEGTDDIDLTDGKKKTGNHFWRNKTTVGWNNKQEIKIDLDLGDVFSIDRFLINTVRGEGADVIYPLSCHVFTSLDSKLFEYHGDLMLTGDYTSGNYKVDNFSLVGIKSEARYVKFVINTNGKYLFLDEIEVYGNKAKANFTGRSKQQLINKKDLDAFISKALKESIGIRQARGHLESVKEYLGNTITENINDFEEQDLSKVILDAQNKALRRDIIFTPINSVGVLNRFSLNNVTVHQNQSNGKYTYDQKYGLNYFSLINNKTAKQSLVLRASNGLKYAIYEILPVASQNKVNIKDALIPVSNSLISMGSGESKFFVVQALQQNESDGSIQILNLEEDELVAELTINESPVKSSRLDENLEVNLWAYLDKPVMKDNIDFVVNDLENAGVDVVVVNSVFIDGYDTKDFSKLKNYLKNFNNIQNKKILLFYNFKSKPERKFNGRTFLDKTWKRNFDKWYRLMQNELAMIGVNESEIYFYPYDEIKPDEVDNFIELVKWGRTFIPGFKTFVTISSEKSFEAGRFADIVQISKAHLGGIKKLNNKNIWLYDVFNQSRDRDPYKDYRLISWYAYYYDLKGVGFWNYSNLSTENDAYYNKVVNGNMEYSVIYLDDNKEILLSLRWLCFQEGLNDYKILKAYENLVGKDKVKSLVKKVIDNPENSEEANKALKNLFEAH